MLRSLDEFIISGHQRRQAAIDTGCYQVPTFYCNERRSEQTPDSWLAVLREHNAQREKSFNELVGEKLLDINPQDAVRQIVDEKVERSRPRIATIEIGADKMTRSEITEPKFEMCDAVLEVLNDLDDYLPVSVRAIHYRLLDKKFFRNSKLKTRYENKKDCSKDLSDLVVRTRKTG